jgi:hypothetical protein
MEEMSEISSEISFKSVLKGWLSLFQVPDLDGLSILVQSRCTCLVVFLTKNSTDHINLESYCHQSSISFLPVISNGITEKTMNTNKINYFLLECLHKARVLLQSGGRIIINYKSRIAKSAIFTYALLRVSGDDPIASREKIKEMKKSKKWGKIFDIGELLALKALHNNTHISIQELKELTESKTIENPLIFIKFTNTLKLKFRLDCVVTDKKLEFYAIGPTGFLDFDFFMLFQILGNEWMAKRSISSAIGGPTVEVQMLENQLLEFFYGCFGTNKVTWAGPLIHHDIVFFKRFCPDLIRVVGEEIVRSDQNAKETIFHEILEYKRSLVL